MADSKNIDAQIAEKEKEIAKLKADAEELKSKNLPQYPKHIRVDVGENDPQALRDADGKPYIIVEVKSEEEEKNAGKKGGATPLPASAVVGDDRKAVAKAEEEAKEAAAAKKGGRR